MSEEIYCRLVSDLRSLKLPIDEVELFIRPFSKTFYGRYFPSYETQEKPRIFIYPFTSETNKECYCYSHLLSTAIHEMVHHIQYTNSSFVRYKGVMHDTQFWQLYNHYINRAIKLEKVEVKSYENQKCAIL